MRRTGVVLAVLAAGILGGLAADERSARLRDADHFKWAAPEPFPSRLQWEVRARQLRSKLLLSAGLWPGRERTPLDPRIFDVREGDGFRVGKVYFESLPGFLATGNIYYPTSGKPPYPAILTPHGHWTYGRLQNTDTGSIPGRCIDFARQGYVVFSIDMVGYNDSFQLPHDGSKSRAQLAADSPLPYEPRLYRSDFIFPEAELYGFNLGGIQLWNGIRALDFLSSLPEVDGSRIGVTGASGGATQTILLMAADDRVRAAAPVNIIGAEKHPGCGCENLPGLWVDTSTIELAATFAPRPLLLVSATEDPWTHSTPTRELPIMRKYYGLFGAEDRVANVHVKAAHNYNAQSRAAVYRFFREHLNPAGPAVNDPPPIAAEMKQLGDLRVFPDTLLPEAARQGRAVAEEWQKSSTETVRRALPGDAGALQRFRAEFGPALQLVLSVEKPAPESLVLTTGAEEPRGGRRMRRDLVGRKAAGDSVELESISPSGPPSAAVLLAAPESFGRLDPEGGTGACLPWIRTLLDKGTAVYRIRGYASGQLRIPDRTWNSFAWSSAYNRPNQVHAIQDIVTAIATIRRTLPAIPLTVIGLEDAGFPAAFAAAVHGGAARVILDMNGEDPGYDRTLLRLLPVGSIRCVGDFTTALLLIDGEIELLNPGPTFDRTRILELQKATGMRVAIRDTVVPADPGFLRTGY